MERLQAHAFAAACWQEAWRQHLPWPPSCSAPVQRNAVETRSEELRGIVQDSMRSKHLSTATLKYIPSFQRHLDEACYE